MFIVTKFNLNLFVPLGARHLTPNGAKLFSVLSYKHRVPNGPCLQVVLRTGGRFHDQ